MKVVLFCGGLGLRMKDYPADIPKPLIEIGKRPVLWNLMKYYAHFGHKDFVLCLGYKAEMIKRFFLNYNEAISNDFILSDGGNTVKLLNTDIQNWKITFVDTGFTSNIGQRLVAVKKFLLDEDVFLANYTDGLTDLNLNEMLAFFNKQNKIAVMLGAKSTQSFHVVDINKKNDLVGSIKNIGHSDLWINGGFYIFKKDIFKYIKEGEDLVAEPFNRLIQIGELSAYRYEGFWGAIDTFKDKQFFDELYIKGTTPWEVWKKEQKKE